jgi:enoyl-CoA hydratase
MSDPVPAVVRWWTDGDGVGHVHLDNPDQRNVLSKQCTDEIAAGVAAVLADAAGAIVLTAAAPVFCAGGSIDAMLSQSVPLADYYAGLQALAEAPVPTIAAVDGAAIGAGCSLALACDVILATPAARFDPRFLDAGIHPGGGVLWRLARRVGEQGAAALVLTGDTLTGEEAAAAGLAWRCVTSDELEAAAMALAARAAGRSRPLMARTKQTLRRTVSEPDVAVAAALELTAQEWSVEQPDYLAAVAAIKARLAAPDSPR